MKNLIEKHAVLMHLVQKNLNWINRYVKEVTENIQPEFWSPMFSVDTLDIEGKRENFAFYSGRPIPKETKDCGRTFYSGGSKMSFASVTQVLYFMDDCKGRLKLAEKNLGEMIEKFEKVMQTYEK